MSNKTSIVIEPGKQNVRITRVFDAPRDLVYKACTDAAAVAKWWGPGFLETTVEKMEVRYGGMWKIVQRDPSGNTFGFHGVYHLAVAPERMVRTFEFEGVPGHVMMESILLEDEGGKTKLTVNSVFQSQEDRDGMVSAGMEAGTLESHDRLEALLNSMQGK